MKRTREHIIQDGDLLVTKLEDGQLEVRRVVLDENGDSTYHRHVVSPGQFLGDQDARVKEVAERVHTPRVVASFREAESLRQLDA